MVYNKTKQVYLALIKTAVGSIASARAEIAAHPRPQKQQQPADRETLLKIYNRLPPGNRRIVLGRLKGRQIAN